MSWATPPEQVQAPPAVAPVPPPGWRPRGPAVVRTLVAAVVAPGSLYAVGRIDTPPFDASSLDDGIGTRYWLVSVVALAVLGVLLWVLVAQARTRPALPMGGPPGQGALVAAVALFALSGLYLLVIPLAIVVFLVAALLLAPAGLVAVACAVLAILGLVNARGGHRGPSQQTATLAATAGWVVATVVMPVAGGQFVLWAAG